MLRQWVPTYTTYWILSPYAYIQSLFVFHDLLCHLLGEGIRVPGVCKSYLIKRCLLISPCWRLWLDFWKTFQTPGQILVKGERFGFSSRDEIFVNKRIFFDVSFGKAALINICVESFFVNVHPVYDKHNPPSMQFRHQCNSFLSFLSYLRCSQSMT